MLSYTTLTIFEYLITFIFTLIARIFCYSHYMVSYKIGLINISDCLMTCNSQIYEVTSGKGSIYFSIAKDFIYLLITIFFLYLSIKIIDPNRWQHDGNDT